VLVVELELVLILVLTRTSAGASARVFGCRAFCSRHWKSVLSLLFAVVRASVWLVMFRFMCALSCACGSVALRGREAGGDFAAELAGAIADIARKVALEDGYGDEFASAFSAGQRRSTAANGAVAFADVRGGEADYTLTLRPPEEAMGDVAQSVSALEAAGVAERNSAKESYAAAWQRMLDAEKRATQSILRSELASLAAAGAQGA